MILRGHAIDRGKIPEILQNIPEINSAINLWAKYKKFGWPYAGGWAEQPAKVFDVIDTLEAEDDKIKEEERKHGSKR